MPKFQICRRFTVESGHMLSRHPEKCRYPHGHTRTIEVIVGADSLDENGMVVDFKALKKAVAAEIEKYDHSMSINSGDPLLQQIEKVYPESLIVFEDEDPTTEVIARDLFEKITQILANGFEEGHYKIPVNRVVLERLRVWETPNSWAEVSR